MSIIHLWIKEQWIIRQLLFKNQQKLAQAAKQHQQQQQAIKTEEEKHFPYKKTSLNKQQKEVNIFGNKNKGENYLFTFAAY